MEVFRNGLQRRTPGIVLEQADEKDILPTQFVAKYDA